MNSWGGESTVSETNPQVAEATAASSSDAGSSSVDLQDWVGRTTTVHDVADARSASRLQTLLSDETRNEAEAADATGAVLNPVGHWLHFADDVALSDSGADGHPKLGGFMPPVPLSRRMWAASSLTFHAPIPVGAALSRTTRIVSVTEKQGSTGPLCFVVLEHEIGADGTRAVTDRQTIVYREAPPVTESAAPPRTDAPVPDGWEWSRTVRPTEPMLFRYSALTYNSHRIHYDHTYVTEVEGYPGLVTHGPLTATLLLDSFRRTHPDAIVTGYDFRAKSPLFVGEQIHFVGRRTGETTHEIAAIGPGGLTAIAATVTTASAITSENVAPDPAMGAAGQTTAGGAASAEERNDR